MASRGKKIVSLEVGPAVVMLQEALSAKAIPLVKNAFRRAALGYAKQTRDRLRAATKKHTGNLSRAEKHKGTKGGGAKVYVDKSGGTSGRGFHWHLVERGSKGRRTRKGANRGKMPASPYVNQVTDAAADRFAAEIIPGIVAQVRKKLEGGK